MTGTLGRALEVRGIPSFPEKLSSRVEGDIEDVDGVMVITTIRIHYKIRLQSGKKPEAERALSVHERGCPAAMSVKNCISVQWTAEFVQE
jgi:organic hydroperoxide reductase OsmC/OhrA